MKEFNPVLGQNVEYPSQYAPHVLCRIDRAQQRQTYHSNGAPVPFIGQDIWLIYELSWLDPQFKPQRRFAVLKVPCTSPYLLESKSLKLYFYSLNQTVFAHDKALQTTVINDLSQCLGQRVAFDLYALNELNHLLLSAPNGTCIDHHQVTHIDERQPNPTIIKGLNNKPLFNTERLIYTELFRSLCPITQQPDWATIIIRYSGKPLDEACVLNYLLSYRNHCDFHEQCIETIFTDLMQCGFLSTLSVLGCFYRRGGISINPYRSTSQQTTDILGLYIQ